MCGCLSRVPRWGPSLQSRHVPRLGIKPATPLFTGWHSIQWATPAGILREFWLNNLPAESIIFPHSIFLPAFFTLAKSFTTQLVSNQKPLSIILRCFLITHIYFTQHVVPLKSVDFVLAHHSQLISQNQDFVPSIHPLYRFQGYLK